MRLVGEYGRQRVLQPYLVDVQWMFIRHSALRFVLLSNNSSVCSRELV